MNKSWHPDHFFCALCGKLFDEDNLNFFEKDGKAYCKEDYFDKFAVTCKRCSKAIMSGYLSAVGSYWHPNCFSCKVCEVGQVGGSLGLGGLQRAWVWVG
jgi:paxillin